MSGDKKSTVTGRGTRGHQRGAALLIFMIVAVTATLTAIVPQLAPEQVETRRAQQTEEALALARDALLGYAITYRERQTTQDPVIFDAVHGFLPLPDFGESFNRNGDFDHPCSTEGCAKTNAAGFSGSEVLIGRLPWKTLGLPPLRDGYGECLWYAVAASHRAIASSATRMNWDTLAAPDILVGSGRADLSGIDRHDRPIAVIFSAGPAFSGGRTTTADAPLCGGNYDPAHYLNPDIGNRQPAMLITSEALFSLLRRSSVETAGARASRVPSFVDDINRMLDGMVECLRNTSLALGRLPTRCAEAMDAHPPAGYYRHYQDQVFVVPCTSCVINDTPRPDCAGVLLFSNQRGDGQTRHGSALDDPTNYLEAPNLQSLQNAGGIFRGPERFASQREQAVHQDIVRCIPNDSSFVELDNDLNDDGTPEFANLARFDAATRTISLGSPAPVTGAAAANHLFACLWTPEAHAVGAGFRSYFRFRVRKRGEGFTFAIVDGERNGSQACGAAGQHLGYSGENPFLALPYLHPPKIALEFDLARNPGFSESGNMLTNGRNDPCYQSSCGATQNLQSNAHVAIAYWGYAAQNASNPTVNHPRQDDNVHGHPVFPGPLPQNPLPIVPYPPTPFLPPYPVAAVDRMAGTDGSKREFHARIEVSRVPGSTSTELTTRLWLEPHPAASIDSIVWETNAAACANPVQRPALRITAPGHGFNVGNRVLIKDAVPKGYNGSHEVAQRIDSNHFRVCLDTGRTHPGPYIREINWARNAAGQGEALITAPDHGLAEGALVSIDGAFPVQYNVANAPITWVSRDSFRIALPLASDPGNLERAIVAAASPTPRAMRLALTDRSMSLLEPGWVPTIAHTATIRDEAFGACDIHGACPSGQVCGADRRCYVPVFRQWRLGFTMGERQSTTTTARNQLIYLSDMRTTWLP